MLEREPIINALSTLSSLAVVMRTKLYKIDEDFGDSLIRSIATEAIVGSDNQELA